MFAQSSDGSGLHFWIIALLHSFPFAYHLLRSAAETGRSQTSASTVAWVRGLPPVRSTPNGRWKCRLFFLREVQTNILQSSAGRARRVNLPITDVEIRTGSSVISDRNKSSQAKQKTKLIYYSHQAKEKHHKHYPSAKTHFRFIHPEKGPRDRSEV